MFIFLDDTGLSNYSTTNSFLTALNGNVPPFLILLESVISRWNYCSFSYCGLWLTGPWYFPGEVTPGPWSFPGGDYPSQACNRGGYPSQVCSQGYPLDKTGGTTSLSTDRTGLPPRQESGTPPLPPRQDRGVPPSKQTAYATVGTPLADTQEDFLLSLNLLNSVKTSTEYSITVFPSSQNH